MRIAVVILNWNTKDYLRLFLPGVVESCARIDGARTVVADSGSTDGSVEFLSESFPDVTTIPLGENFGFTGGYNRAMGALLDAHPELEYLVLLNSDIDVPPTWLGPLVGWMDTHPGCAVCGPKLHALDRVADGCVRTERFEYAGAAGGYLDRFGFPFCRGRVLDRVEEDHGQYDSARDVFWVSGACMVVRARVWKDLGGLDPRFFAHMEEIDFCWRAARKGWKITVVPESVVWHLGGGSLPKTSPLKLKLNFRNNMLMLEKNLRATAGPWRAAVRILVRKILNVGAALCYLIAGKKDFAAAVMEGIGEAGRMVKEKSGSCRGNADVIPYGYFGLCILPTAAILKDKVFKYLIRYEDSH